MKKYLLGVLVLILVFACSTNEQQMTLTGSIDGLKKGTVLLQKIEDTVLVSVDSVHINGDETFQLSEAMEEPEVYFLYLRLKNGDLLDERIPFFAEPKEMSITTSLENFGSDAKISGSENQDKIAEYNKLIKRYTDRNLDLIKSELEAMQSNNDSLIAAIQKQKNTLRSGRVLATVNFAKNHSEYELAPYLMLTEAFDVQVKYMDTVYHALTPKIKDSKYGVELESLIAERKNDLD
ncbi:MAG: DUF4369 domain-containing protein [Flavobacteriales bacterium]|jgi:hypothetical protein|nr:DUF4369 domain-containing protein [Flavobacteriales bacterium]